MPPPSPVTTRQTHRAEEFRYPALVVVNQCHNRRAFRFRARPGLSPFRAERRPPSRRHCSDRAASFTATSWCSSSTRRSTDTREVIPPRRRSRSRRRVRPAARLRPGTTTRHPGLVPVLARCSSRRRLAECRGHRAVRMGARATVVGPEFSLASPRPVPAVAAATAASTVPTARI